MPRIRTFQLYSDPGHGWLKVTRGDLKRAGLIEKISSFSYQRGESVFLEEDCDLALFLSFLKREEIQFKIKESTAQKSSKIRNYTPYTPGR